ncbi:DMT family transporter [Roseivirga sp. E12]|uniref:DMT family transporter n=1 Tax=Roseivirga sp. E12 TaxID=2819237 RepID=UPI001ABCBEC8|nr:EamA family transporter [Roseivirga sp. E12]MBO3697412.1 EamA family transporter [Roseivirga sp. E12]
MFQPRQRQALLFGLPVLIWGSTWYAITFQLGTVDPLISVAYRFWASCILLLGFCLLTKRSLKFNLNQHLRMALQGALLFGFNYWLVYQAEELINSGLVAIGFSTIIFFNIIFGVLLLRQKVESKVIGGALLGLIGTSIIFWNEISQFEATQDGFLGVTLCVVSVMIASLGNITSAKNSSLKIPVVQATGFGMMYGAIIMTILAIVLGKPLEIDTGTGYLLSMGYLIVFGSIIAFVAYLTLISEIGPGKAAYSIVLVPLVAVTISTFLEDFQFTFFTGLGMVFLVSGNFFALKRKKALGK